MDIIVPLLLLFPLAGALVQLGGQRHLSRRTLEVAATLAVGASFMMAALALVLGGGEPHAIELYRWIAVAEFNSAITLQYDPISGVMALMVTFVATLIHLYSVAYMAADQDHGRYFCYLNLFVFNMLVIVLAGDLLFLFLGWEGVGFCSYALIGFWYKDNANALAGSKAFILTRIGDVALLIAIGLLFTHGGSLALTEINRSAALLPPEIATLIGLLLLVAAAGKSAQLPLSVWLPDAMAGPTPVSALIHAATMVTAGVYLLIRLFPVLSLSPLALKATALIGILTALYGALAALAQVDIKRVLAYSTMSQVGFMVLGLGAGSAEASLFHLLSHAFFKALLFLGAGCLIRAAHGEHDIRRLGPGLRQRYPLLFWPFLFGIASLAGIPLTAGFFSKGQILEAAHGASGNLSLIPWLLALLTAVLTSLYSFRLLFLVFPVRIGAAGPGPRRPSLPGAMLMPLWPLGVLAVIAGLINLPLGSDPGWLSRLIATAPLVPVAEHGQPPAWGLAVLDANLSLLGLLLAYLCYGPRPLFKASPEQGGGGLVTRFARDGFGLDRLYQLLFGRGYRAVAGWLCQGVDQRLVDTLLLLPGRVMIVLGQGCRLWATGRLTTGLHGLLAGVTLLLSLAALKFSGLLW